MFKRFFTETRVLAVTLLLLTLFFTNKFGPSVEGMLFPVVTPLTITDVRESVDRTQITVEGDFAKLRNCRYVAQEWRLGTRNRYAVVRRDPGGVARNLPPADRHHVGPYVLYMTQGQFRTSAHAITLHRCHPLWLTASVFYES